MGGELPASAIHNV
jgi:hypothetical protein